MAKNQWFWLQLFAGEGAGASAGGEGSGDGTVSGENSLAAGDQRLRELGVPEDKLRKRAQRAKAKMPEGAVRTAPMQAQEPKPQEQVATAEENPTEDNANAPSESAQRKSWDEIKKEYAEDYQKETQDIVKKRLRSSKAADEALAKLTPALEVLARKYGQDPANPDYEALAKAIDDDDAYYEDKALELGVSLETAKRVDREERDTARQQREEEITMEQQRFDEHIRSLEQQGEALKKVFPNFNLSTELQNPVFARMTAPGTGIMSVEDAYRAVHRKEIEAAQSQVIAQQTAQQISNAIKAGSRRPDENGISGRSPSVTTFNYSQASKEQRADLKRQIYAAAARGEKLYPVR